MRSGKTFREKISSTNSELYCQIAMALSNAIVNVLKKSLFFTACFIVLPSSKTTSGCSRLPLNISFVIVSANPFHEIRNPNEHLLLRFSIFCLKITNSFFPHLLVQFLHSTIKMADSLRNRGSSLLFNRIRSISSVSVSWSNPLIESPGIVSNNLYASSSSALPFSCAD